MDLVANQLIGRLSIKTYSKLFELSRMYSRYVGFKKVVKIRGDLEFF